VADPAQVAVPRRLEPVELPAQLVATLVLVRHGESTWVAEGRFQGRQDPPLSELGTRQAQLVANRLAHRDEQTPLPIPVGMPSAVWHSPLSRAAATARMIASAQPTPVPLRPIDDLIEIAQGDWEGQPQAVVRQRWADELAAWRRAPATSNAPHGERLVDAAARVRNALGVITADLDSTALPRQTANIALAFDPVPGYDKRPTAADVPPEPWAPIVAHDGIFRLCLINLLGIPLERFWSFPFNLAAITVVTLHNGVCALRAHNLSEHLAPLATEERAAQESRGDRRGAL
jgi:broad specificity phosphatase PhoE